MEPEARTETEMETEMGTETEARTETETETEMEARTEMETEMETEARTETETETEAAACQPVVRARQLGWYHVLGWGYRVLGWHHHRTIAGGSRSGLRSLRVLAKSVLAPQDVHPLP